MVAPLQQLLAIPQDNRASELASIGSVLGNLYGTFQGVKQNREVMDYKKQQDAAEKQRMAEEREIKDGARDAIIAHSIKDPARRQIFLQRRVDALDKQGRDSSDTRALMGLSFDQQNDELLRMGSVLVQNYPGEGLMEALGIGKRGEPYTLSEGQVRFDANNRPISANPKTPDDKEIQPKIDKLRSQVSDYTKTFRAVEESYNRIKSSADKPSAAGDLSLIFNYMKMLDPGSVVRESEFQVAAQSGDYGERIQGFVNRTLNGQRLSEDIRKDFVTRAEQLFNAQRLSTDNQIGNVLQLADQDKIDRVKVLGEERLKDFQERTNARVPQDGAAQSNEDQQALEWAKQNPNDPRAQQILRMLGP